MAEKPEGLDIPFRLLDDDGLIYAEGYSDNSNSFAPLDRYGPDYGCTDIQYYSNGKWRSL